MSEVVVELVENLKKHPKRWLVTGAAGFIGSNLVEFLLSQGQYVVGLDNFATGFKWNIDDAIESAARSLNISVRTMGDHFKFLEGDIRRSKDCEAAFKELDLCFRGRPSETFVLHQAALGSVPRSIEDPLASHEVNVTGFLNMLVAARNAGIARFVYAASSSTYGDHKALPKVESTIGKPLSPYAVTKHVNELYARVFSDVYGLDTVGIRYFNVFGKRQDPDGSYAAVVPKWIAKIMKLEEITVNGDGRNSRDFTYIDNIVQINLLSALANKKIAGEVFNGAYGEQTSLNELIDAIKNSFKMRNYNVEDVPVKYGDPRVGDVLHSLASIEKSRSVLGYKPSHSIKQGLYETVSWFQERGA